MCGIAGALSRADANAERLLDVVRGMLGALRHRGPDDLGVWTDEHFGGIVLGHCRLAIIDVTEEGHQPMISRCGRYVISLNGEIYNFVEIEFELKKLGTQFRGHSDTEVFIEAISRWGLLKTLSKVVGMYAFALWDKLECKLYLVRDRIGKKPLYYQNTNGALYFASEIKALRTLGLKALELDLNSLGHYLTCGFVPSPHTIYKGISEILPGHYAVFNNRRGSQCSSYWMPEWTPKVEATFDEVSEQVEILLKEAVRIRMRADVPIGCFLSSGIDSGLIVALARNTAQDLTTLTVSVGDRTVDEAPLANIVAKKYETDHHVIRITPDLEQDIPKMIASYDQPFADPSAIPSFLISLEARKHVKVVINGDGGDEILGGYRRHRAISLYSRFPLRYGGWAERLIKLIKGGLPTPRRFRSYYSYLHRFARGMNSDPYERYIAWSVDGFDSVEKRNILLDKGNGSLEETRDLLASRLSFLEDLDPVDHFLAMDLLFHLPDCLLVKMDRATMAHGLEARSPLLDHRLVEFSCKLSQYIKLPGLKTKPILRKIAKKYLPEVIVSAPKKGFEIPLLSWLRNDLAPMVRDVCLQSDGIISELFERKYVEDLVNEKLPLDPGRWANRVWILFVLGLWDAQSNRN